MRQIADVGPDRDNVDVFDLADDFKFHSALFLAQVLCRYRQNSNAQSVSKAAGEITILFFGKEHNLFDEVFIEQDSSSEHGSSCGSNLSIHIIPHNRILNVFQCQNSIKSFGRHAAWVSFTVGIVGLGILSTIYCCKFRLKDPRYQPPPYFRAVLRVSRQVPGKKQLFVQ